MGYKIKRLLKKLIKMAYLIYNLLLFCFAPIYILRVLLKNRGFKERFVFSLPAVEPTKKLIWIHAVSVGEVVASKPLISLIKKELPDYKIALSTVTKTGRAMAKKLKDNPDYIFYFPFDFPLTIKKALKRIKPSAIVLAETELWPNLLRYSQRLNIPVVMVNGTISKSSFAGYSKFPKFSKQILNKVSFFCVQTEEDKNKLLHLKIKKDKIKVTGNTKFDCYGKCPGTDKELLKNWNVEGRTPIIAAGSTHPGEEEMVLDVFRTIEKTSPQVLLILAPRHPERVPKIEGSIKQQGYSYIKRTKMNSSEVKKSIILIDTIGELLNIYSTADIIFMGGSLVPIGGHNFLEPASMAKPIITGPYTFKQSEMVSLLKRGNGIVQVQNKKYLQDALIELLSSPQKMEELGKNAQKVVLENQGATKKNFEVIEKLL